MDQRVKQDVKNFIKDVQHTGLTEHLQYALNTAKIANTNRLINRYYEIYSAEIYAGVDTTETVKKIEALEERLLDLSY